MRRGLTALLLLCAWAALAVHARHYWPFLSDDALISLRYAGRLAHGKGLTWSAGERVEGYTDLLWVLLTALAAKLGAGLIASARVLDAIGAGAAILAVSCSPEPLAVRPVRVLTGGVALALCAPLAVWSVGALEHGFMAGVIAVTLLAMARRDRFTSGALLAALALLRADGVVLVAAAALAALVSWRSLRATATLVAMPAIAVVGQVVFRVAYYGALVPNTAVAKVAFNHERLLHGLHYVANGARPLWPMLVVAALLCIAGARGLARERWVPALSMTLAWTAYQALVGGDIFPGWRQLLPAIVPVATLIAEGAEATGKRWRYGALAAPVVAVPLLVVGLFVQTSDGENRRAVAERWEFDGAAIGPLLARAFGDKQPLLAVDAAGALPFWSGLDCVDMLGLNDKYLPRHPPRGFGTGPIGHELGDGRYVLDRRPDIIAFNNAAGAHDPLFVSGRQMVRTREFREAYQAIRARARGSRVVGALWIRREGGVLGVRRSADSVVIPGYFFAGGGAIAQPEPGGELVTPVTTLVPATLPALRIPPGNWRLELWPPSPAARVRFRCDGVSALPPGDVIALDAPTRLDAIVSTHGSGFSVARAVLRRTRAPGARCPRPGVPGELALADLATSAPDGAAWNAPENIVFGGSGVRVRLPAVSHASVIDASLDANDAYAFDLFSGASAVLSVVAAPVRGRAGLQTRRLAIPETAALAGFDAIQIRPVAGDGSCALGHLWLRP